MKNFNEYIVDIKQLNKNVDNIKAKIGNSKFCAIVKANAYGMGLETICSSIADKVDFFAVATLKEAMKIRVFDKKTKVLILGVIDKSSLEICSKHNISISVGSLEQLKEYLSCNADINIHIQVNTGLNRYGFKTISDFKKALSIIEKNKNIKLEGLYTHFATKASDIVFIKKQFLKYNQFKSLIKDKNVIFHVANSYATLYDKNLHQSMVRNGFLMYGEFENNIGNKPILSIKSHLVNISYVKKNDTIGYDRTFKADKAMKIGVVPIGYADGMFRGLSNNFYVLIGGKKCKIVGLICMDVFMVDLTDVDAHLYDEVVLLGRQGKEKITLQDYADALHTSPYEILLRFSYKRMEYIIKQ